MEDSERYEIVSELGRGGMGVVYRALDTAAGDEVALKVATGRLDGDRLVRFNREGDLTARLDHPGIVRVRSSGHKDGRPFLAYELIDGTSLGETLSTVDLRRRIELIRDTARALGYAHAQGVVHRDVKSENILVDRQGRIRVADFGLASAKDLERLTVTGALVGTPSHMSPEQVDGRARRPGPPSDVWSLGVVMYQALTGELPFTGGTMIELISSILQGRFDSPRQIAHDVPRDLESICLHALQLDPDQRYADGDAFADDLDAWLDGRFTQPRRRPQRVALKAVLAVGALAALLNAPILFDGPLPQEPEPVRESAPALPVVTPAQIRSAWREIERAKRLEPEFRVRKIRRWIDEHAEFPASELAKAQAALDEAQREFPLHVLQHTPAPDDPRPRTRQPTSFIARGTFLDPQTLLTRGDLGIQCWDLRAPSAPVWTLNCNSVGDVALAPGGSHLLVANGRDVLIVELPSRRVTKLAGLVPVEPPARGLSNRVLRVGFAQDGESLVVVTHGVGAFVFSWPDLALKRRINRSYAQTAATSPDGRLLAIGGGAWGSIYEHSLVCPEFLQVFDLQTGAAVFEFRSPSMPWALEFTPDSKAVLLGDRSGAVIELPLNGSPRTLFRRSNSSISAVELVHRGAHFGVISGLRFLDEGLLISVSCLSGDKQGTPELRTWSYPERAELGIFSRPFEIMSLELAGDGRRIAIGSATGRVEVWAVR